MKYMEKDSKFDSDNCIVINDYNNTKIKEPFIINVEGAKNSILPLMISKLLVPGKTKFTNSPINLEDVKVMINILSSLGLECKSEGLSLDINNTGVAENIEISKDLASKTRYSSLLLGALASLNRNFCIPFPGGCKLQFKRPLDVHYDCLRKIGYKVNEKFDFIECEPIDSSNGDVYIKMKKISVGATLNSILASILKNQTTLIDNVAIEPEIKDVIDFLKKSGANITLIEKNRQLKIIGVKQLKPVYNWNVIDDRINGMTYFISALMLNKSAILHLDYKLVESTLEKLKEIGFFIHVNEKQIIYKKTDNLILKNQKIEFTPYPGIPTDLQPIFCVLMTQVPGQSILIDKVFNQRTQYINELIKLGANIIIENLNGQHIIKINRSFNLNGTNLSCTDIRGGMAIILAALLAKGKSEISNIYQVNRGYNSFVDKLKSFGFSISYKGEQKSFIEKFNASQWPIKIDEPWEKSLYNPFLTIDSNICVIGDCFARNFSRWFLEQGIKTGKFIWGIHFHQKAILRELERTLKKDNTPNIFWELKDNSGKLIYVDPFRFPVEGYSIKELEEKKNRIEIDKINYFKKTELFVISLSIGEIWEQKINGKWYALGRGPTKHNFSPEIFRYRILEIEETKKDIKNIISVIKEINAKSKIIFMVSPVPLKHSLHDEHIYISNNRSKIILLGAIYEVMNSKPENVLYFPSYEIVQKDNKKSYWQKDKRHVTAECVVDVCQHFVNSYFLDKDLFNINISKLFKVREVNQEGKVVKELELNSLNN